MKNQKTEYEKRTEKIVKQIEILENKGHEVLGIIQSKALTERISISPYAFIGEDETEFLISRLDSVERVYKYLDKGWRFITLFDRHGKIRHGILCNKSFKILNLNQVEFDTYIEVYTHIKNKNPKKSKLDDAKDDLKSTVKKEWLDIGFKERDEIYKALKIPVAERKLFDLEIEKYRLSPKVTVIIEDSFKTSFSTSEVLEKIKKLNPMANNWEIFLEFIREMARFKYEAEEEMKSLKKENDGS